MECASSQKVPVRRMMRFELTKMVLNRKLVAWWFFIGALVIFSRNIMDFNRTVGGDIVIDVIFNNKIIGGMRTRSVVHLDINYGFQLEHNCFKRKSHVFNREMKALS